MPTVRAAYAKNGESRSVPMNDALTVILKAIRMNAVAEGWVFCSRTGTLSRSFRSAFENAAQQAGFGSFHLPRFAAYLCESPGESSVDLPTVQGLLGHKDISMTLQYTDLFTDHK